MESVAMGIFCLVVLWAMFRRPATKTEAVPKPAVKRVKVQRLAAPQWGAWDDAAWDGSPIVPWETPATKKHWWRK